MVVQSIIIKTRQFFHGRRTQVVSGLLLLALLLGSFLRFYRLGASGVGNAYYGPGQSTIFYDCSG